MISKNESRFENEFENSTDKLINDMYEFID